MERALLVYLKLCLLEKLAIKPTVGNFASERGKAQACRKEPVRVPLFHFSCCAPQPEGTPGADATRLGPATALPAASILVGPLLQCRKLSWLLGAASTFSECVCFSQKI